MIKTCYIAGAGDFFPQRLNHEAGDYIIAADAGYTHLEKMGIKPDLVIGDFDSLGAVPEHPNVIVCPVKKDDTDMLAAVRYALDINCNRILLFGGTGGRLDHTLANIQTLGFAAKRGAQAYLFGAGFVVTALTGGKLRFFDYSGGFSVFSLGDSARGVFETGVKYPLHDAELFCDYPLGVSNAFEGADSEISVREGTLVILWEGNETRSLPEKEEQ